MTEYLLDPRLEAESLRVAQLALCDVRLLCDARFPWLVLVPRRAGLIEIFDLGSSDRARLMEETAMAAKALREATDCAKINVGALGNIVRQLHIHVVARREADAAWPGPVWGSGAARRYADGAAEEFLSRLRTLFPAA